MSLLLFHKPTKYSLRFVKINQFHAVKLIFSVVVASWNQVKIIFVGISDVVFVVSETDRIRYVYDLFIFLQVDFEIVGLELFLKLTA